MFERDEPDGTIRRYEFHPRYRCHLPSTYRRSADGTDHVAFVTVILPITGQFAAIHVNLHPPVLDRIALDDPSTFAVHLTQLGRCPGEAVHRYHRNFLIKDRLAPRHHPIPFHSPQTPYDNMLRNACRVIPPDLRQPALGTKARTYKTGVHPANAERTPEQ